ncbi:hypothetical protein PAXRUDRAFT_802860, partial [Paxillus rubicundulus Ve08.2h10]
SDERFRFFGRTTATRTSNGIISWRTQEPRHRKARTERAESRFRVKCSSCLPCENTRSTAVGIAKSPHTSLPTYINIHGEMDEIKNGSFKLQQH